jgi:hypothetical protein
VHPKGRAYFSSGRSLPRTGADVVYVKTADFVLRPETPGHIAYHVRNGNSEKGYWTRIGAAWAHADGNGFNIQIETLPLDGRITLRIASEKSE